MNIDIEAIDLRDNQIYSAVLESQETLELLREVLECKIPNAPVGYQHFYVRDELIKPTTSAAELRRKSLESGMLDHLANDAGPRKCARCYLAVAQGPLDFKDALMEDVAKKMRERVIELKQITFRMQYRKEELKLTLTVDSKTITVNDFKYLVLRRIGATEATGLSVQSLLLYVRGSQPGKPLEGDQLQGLFGNSYNLDIDGYPMNDVCVRLAVKRFLGLLTVERQAIFVLDHWTVEELKKEICSFLAAAKNPKVQKLANSPEALKIKLNGCYFSFRRKGRLLKQLGVPADELWLKTFKMKDGSKVSVYL